MKRKTGIITVSVVVAALAGIAIAVAQNGEGVAPAANPSSIGTALLPVTSNPIHNTSTAPGLEVIGVQLEDNIDSVTGAAISDRLQVTLLNTTDRTLDGFEIYYVMTDVTTGASEAYFLPLDRFTLAANSEGTLDFDGATGPGHYPENRFSIYRTSNNQVDFSVEVSANGVAIATGTGSKSVGTGEQPD